MSSPAPAQQIVTGGWAGAVLAALLLRASRAYGTRETPEKSVQPTPVDFTTLGRRLPLAQEIKNENYANKGRPEGGRSKGALSVSRQRNERVLFTDGRSVTRRNPALRDGPIVVQMMEVAGGSVTAMPVPTNRM
eukprot:151699-Pleurochrysis_carterae.AAC.3